MNAKFHEKEAEIVAQAGRLGSVTIATNMAGRGTDIMLGGNPEHMAMNDIRREVEDETLLPNIEGHENTDDTALLAYRKKYHDLVEKYKEEIKEEKQKVMEAGGLHIIGTQRHESRRIDNQLRGRAGRQGDPGSSKFYISTEDDLMRLFGGEMLKNLIQKYGEGDDVPLKHKLITKRIETAQRNVEANNFRTRKHVLQYDDVMNQQRNIIYGERKKLLDEDNIKSQILDMIDSEIDFIVDSAAVDFDKTAEWNAPAAALELERVFGVVPKEADTPNAMKEEVKDLILDEYKRREDEFGEENIRNIERILLLRVVDEKWMDQIDAMDQLKTGIGLRAYGQKDPVQAYQIEGSQMFEDMNREIRSDFLRFLFHVEDPEKVEKKRMSKNIKEGASDKQQTIKRQAPKVGRNDPCPCGSGKKYKNCCGRNE